MRGRVCFWRLTRTAARKKEWRKTDGTEVEMPSMEV